MATATFGASADCYIQSYSSAQDRNTGITPTLNCYGNTGELTKILMKFDLSSIAEGETVSSAILGLRQTSTKTNNLSASVYRGLTQWYEGLRNKMIPTVGQDGSVWDFRNYNGSVVWGTGAGTEGGLAGTDYAAVATDSSVILNGEFTYWDITADAQYWVANPASNHGFWLIRDSDEMVYYLFASREYTTDTSFRPKLTVTYGSTPRRRTLLGVGS